jgi:hypothetical protein
VEHKIPQSNPSNLNFQPEKKKKKKKKKKKILGAKQTNHCLESSHRLQMPAQKSAIRTKPQAQFF